MKRSVWLAAFVLLTLGAASASADTMNVKIGTSLPDGMTVFVTVGGDGANCRGAGSGKVSGGTVTISFDFHCDPSGRPPSTSPNANCRVFARGLDEKSGTQYRGTDKLTPTTVPDVYQASFNMAKVPPTP